MELQGSIIAIKSIEESVWSDFLTAFNYIDLENNISFNRFDNFQDYISANNREFNEKDIFLVCRWRDDKATYIFDSEMVDSADDEALIKFSALQQQSISTFLSERISNTFRLSLINQKSLTEIHLQDGKIINETGDIKVLGLGDSFNPSEIIEVSGEYQGFDLLPESTLDFEVFQLKWTDEYKKYFDKYIDITVDDIVKMSIPQTEKKKSKWKFW